MKAVFQITRFYVHWKWFFLLCAGFCFFCTIPVCAEAKWRVVAPGVEYQAIPNPYTPWSYVHVFRIQLAQHALRVVRAKEQAFVKELATTTSAKLAINAGFFDQHFRPLGLRVSEGKQINAAKPITWWSVFFTQNRHAHIQHTRQFSLNPAIDFAIQSGPRLLVEGEIPATLKPGRDERTALGITKTGAVLLVVTEHAPLTTYELANIMRQDPIAAWQAINLDGGSSTQLYANFDDLKLDVHGLSPVADALVVMEKD